ncbi:hypothetical protein [Streptomyces clavuligerus]|uniref:Uncharacterized protein n=1 Tax=Streptomyces clavuligerus TaxID=1901 RepID=B5GWA0_STRCL|nr:hypothetical protein [Streptomyces clavuligerus]ANW17677.1 hypothetical protein BB341_05265 [Streptomyces clavuligerus]AXU12227.1 hypothetical protein D1794_05465 [Streptomyces clavuligerus]EDY50596.1 hypothetical protein SSCG_03409 [Streptomyces clavuligerus]EFG09800.1 Hypothetical protein SCLAV_4728 [Streptomyces clavuligerus]MBY6302097.1 hypothetical protein [Streptomyces clavuligerus]
MSLHAEEAPEGPCELRMIRIYDCVVPERVIVVARVAFTVFANTLRAGKMDHLMASDEEMADATELVNWFRESGSDPGNL